MFEGKGEFRNRVSEGILRTWINVGGTEGGAGASRGNCKGTERLLWRSGEGVLWWWKGGAVTGEGWVL